MKTSDLPELGVVRLGTPCSQKFDEMPGEGAVRFCASCKLNVYDFAQLTTDEARELLIATEGRLCVRLFVRPDGTLITRDCPTGVSRRRRSRIGSAVAAVSVMTAGAGALEGETEPLESDEVPTQYPALISMREAPLPPVPPNHPQMRGAIELPRPSPSPIGFARSEFGGGMPAYGEAGGYITLTDKSIYSPPTKKKHHPRK